MSYSAIVTDIKAKLTEIADIGLVHTYSRWSNDMNKFLALFSRDLGNGKKEIRGWEMTRVAAPEKKDGNTFLRIHRIKLSGYMGLQDAEGTELIFQGLVEEISDKFRTAEPADGDAAPWWYMDGPNSRNSCVQVETIDSRMYGAVLCHHADIYITVTERIIA
jgi:hypothetical protein